MPTLLWLCLSSKVVKIFQAEIKFSIKTFFYFAWIDTRILLSDYLLKYIYINVGKCPLGKVGKLEFRKFEIEKVWTNWSISMKISNFISDFPTSKFPTFQWASRLGIIKLLRIPRNKVWIQPLLERLCLNCFVHMFYCKVFWSWRFFNSSWFSIELNQIGSTDILIWTPRIVNVQSW